jgi:protein-S-isoprenylcysteine O-methyltransferase Ste14
MTWHSMARCPVARLAVARCPVARLGAAGLSLPDLGPHGEGWFGLQLILFGAVAVAGRAGPAWGGPAGHAASAAGGLLMAAGAFLALRGLVDLRENLTPFPRPLEGARLVERGAYGLVRHPIYGGLILGAFGWGLALASPAALAAAALLAGFFYLKSRREERWLDERFEGYAAYRARTRRFVPWLV